MYYWYDESWFGMHLLWWLFWVALMVWLFGFMRPISRHRVKLYEHPLATLGRRYAAGEIGTDEYEERKRRIEEDLERIDAHTYDARPPAPPIPPTAPPAPHGV